MNQAAAKASEPARPQPPCTLQWVGERVHAMLPGKEQGVAVRVVWARPITGQGQEVSLLDDRKNEVLLLASLDQLDAASRAVADQALARRYLVARIQRVLKTKAHMGTRYFEVETDRGWRRFAMREPSKNVAWLDHGRMMMRDTIGNRYEIVQREALDEHSRAELDKVI